MSAPKRRRSRRQLSSIVESVLSDVQLASQPGERELLARPAPLHDEPDRAPVSLPAPEAPGAPVRHLRRRRSAASLPPLPVPTDIPEDAPGRVEFTSVDVAALELPPVPPPRPAAVVDHSRIEPTRQVGPVAVPVEVIQVAILAVIILVVFLVGMRVTG